MPTLVYPHISCGADVVPFLPGASTKVVEIVLDRLAYHWDADEIQRQHPTLSLAQIYRALAYYHDHQADIDRDIDERLKREDELIASLKPSPIRAKLQAARRGQ